CLYVNVYQKRNTSILTLANELKLVAGSFQETLPSEVQLATAFEQAPAVEDRISNFVNNLLQGIVLVGVVIALFLGWRSALVVMTVIPLSIVLAITTLDFSGYALQQISIAALVIALGLLVDNAIVVIENIVRFRREGYPLRKAAAKGTQEVGYAIVSSTFTTVLAFAPLALLSSGAGEFLRTLPLTVIYALSASLLLALAFTPIITSRVLPASTSYSQKGTWISRQIDWLIMRAYRPSVNFALRRGWVPVVTGVLLLVGASALFPSIGVSFFPTADKSLLLVKVDLPYSASLQRTEQAVRFVEEVLDTTDYVKNYTVNVGHGNPQVYYNSIPEEYKKYHGEIMINFKEWDPATFYATLAQLRNAFAQYSGARITFRELTNGAPFEAPVEILLLGDNLDTLKRVGYDIEEIIRRTPGTQDVDNPMALAKTDVKVAVNRDKASLYGISLLDLDQTVRASLNGIQVDEVVLEEDDETYPMVVRIPFANEPTLDDFGRVYLARDDGQSVPLRQVADVEFKAEYAKISHFNTTRSLGITANVDDPDRTKDITEAIIPALDSYDWPEGYSYYIGGEYETQQESFGDLGTLLAVALLGIFAILVLQFRSLVQPLIIFSAIPLAVTGSFVALFITGWSFSFFAFVGFISLVGIVVNNSIILVDY
ncbi:MAG: efflux RND transporter permease subunit, partial [Bacteroidota bacterium]